MSLFDNRLKARPSVSGLLMLNLLYVLFCFLTSGYRQGDPVFPLCPWLMFNVSWVLTLMLLGVDFLLLKRNYLKRFIIFIARLAVFTLFSVLFQYLISGLKHLVVDTNFFYSMLILLLMGLVTAYGIDSYLERTDKKLGKYGRRVMLLGGSKNKSLLKSLVQTNSALGCLYISQADLTARQAGTSDDLAAAIKRLNIQFVFTEEQLLSDQLLSVQTCCNRMGVELWLYPAEAPLYKIGFWKSIHRLNVRRAQPISTKKQLGLICKRLFDIVFSLLVIIFGLSWITPLLAIVIYKDSKGPIIFKQKRTGLNNKTFTCLKFRSMAVNDQADIKQASASDSRITKLGRRLRDSNLDELPQFFNVLAGDMSVAGPRPHMLKHTEIYAAAIDNYLQRHLMKPGITGWAQCNGWHGETDRLYKMEQRVKYDIDYIDKWNFWMDIDIVFRTVFRRKSDKPIPFNE